MPMTTIYDITRFCHLLQAIGPQAISNDLLSKSNVADLPKI